MRDANRSRAIEGLADAVERVGGNMLYVIHHQPAARGSYFSICRTYPIGTSRPIRIHPNSHHEPNQGKKPVFPWERGRHVIATGGCGPMTGPSCGYHDEKDPTMTFPFDQVVAIAGANRQLALKFFDIARTTGARQAAIGAHAMSALFDPGKVSEVAQEAEQNRLALIADTKAAFEEWQESAGDLLSPESETAQLAVAFEPLRAFFLSPLQAFAAAAPAASDAGAST
ncbi:hypothetical protein [Sphingobium sp. GW456-12-10-14-TSB1]|uniref:hypothetical protein n=1 Tax=Sphingobium sp. GW456-12-10-14-TSB1 TaxID=1987165 RepID=UPI0020CCB17E|nr:hypothetical protein [Sphingobium sp. GW456-12-10-14-TSB1]